MPRRRFLQGLAAGGIAGAAPFPLFGSEAPPRRSYDGPNVIIVRFGGGVRRRETIDPRHTYAPYFCKELTKEGTLYKNMEISSMKGVETSHGQGTIYVLTGSYDKFKNVSTNFLGERFESVVPTVFEYLRKEFEVPEYQTLIINGEDRTDEEFYSFSNHHLFGANYRSNTLSLYRFKVFLLRRQIESGKFSGDKLKEKKEELKKLESIDQRTGGKDRQSAEIEKYWEGWRAKFGDSGFVNSRGDRLLTDLALRAMRELKPKLMMINYNDPDYVHWGNMAHYTRGVAIIDEGIRRLVDATKLEESYRDNTVFVVVPDCGRDTSPFGAVPCQHHFGSKSSREIFAFLMGPGIAKGKVIDKTVDQTMIASTIGGVMGFKAIESESQVLEEALV